MAVHDLSQLQWQLYGWRPYAWKLFRSAETGQHLQGELGPIPARVPGSVQAALLEAGVIEDWHVGTRSRDCEWIEHRHWHYTSTIPVDWLKAAGPVVLDAQGLDGAGWIYLDGAEVGRFEGTHLPHRFDLAPLVTHETRGRLDIYFEEPPREQGQIGWTSRTRHLKPRYSYSWDWSPRVVTVGVWDALTVRTGADAALEVLDLRSSLAEDDATGRVSLTVARTGGYDVPLRYEAAVMDGDAVVAYTQIDADLGDTAVMVETVPVEPWWPNGMGRQRLYTLRVRAFDPAGAEVWSRRFTIGFARIAWQPCEGAPADAEPWICVVNGRPVFLQGIDWSPVRTAFPDTEPDEYRTLVDLYRDLGCTCIRVWGGGLMERTEFMEACDRAGLLVWQDFPLSSSGVENYPPEDPETVAKLVQAAEAHVRRHGHHVSRLLWCGGNELMERDNATPVGYGHPCIAALRRVVERWDPGRRFIATTALGPRFYASREHFGKGEHHNVHGPWGMGGFSSLDDWRDYWAHDDALFRAEVGMPGASDVDLIRRYAGDGPVWPPEGGIWTHSCPWWIDWTRHRPHCGMPDPEEGLRHYVQRTQREQAEALAIAAAACKGRFPRCGGFLIWHGHDCFPCPINNSIIDFERKPKPAYHALRKVFRSSATGEGGVLGVTSTPAGSDRAPRA